MGSLTADLLEHSAVIPVWMVDGEIASTRVMIAVDGSESSLRAVDHLSFMLGENPEIKVTLFHGIPKLTDYCEIDFDEKDSELTDVIVRGDQRCIDSFYARAIKKFEENGIHENQITVKTASRAMNIGKAILDEIRKENCGTVVIGRRGVSKAFFLGSVSRYVIEKVSDCALWLVP
jgi:nucleotide-binding universal stress UspA family protein